MKAEPLRSAAGVVIDGPLLLTPTVLGDARGFFYESWNQRRFAQLLAAHGQTAPAFVQDNHSRSARGVLRGLHWQLPPQPQGKLVRCSLGAIFDVAVDIRRHSPSFGQWVGAQLSADNHQQLWIPPGFAHGFLTLSEQAEVQYKTSDFWSRDCERALSWNDPALGITWPLAALAGSTAQLSAKDAAAPNLNELANNDLFA